MRPTAAGDKLAFASRTDEGTVARALFGAAVLWLVAGAARGQQSFSFAAAANGSGFQESAARSFHREQPPIRIEIGIFPPLPPGFDALTLSGPEIAVPDAASHPHTFWIAAVTVVTLLGSAENSFREEPNQKFHFTNEGWFGRNTYAGGADKASHFVSYYVVAKLLSGVYGELGLPADQARLLGAGVSTFAGFITELGDGRGHYGFSYEDLVMDALGTVTFLGVAHYGLGDLIGFSAGLVPRPRLVCCPYGGFGTDYTQVIYSGDLKVAGLARRARFDPGPARFLLLSLTYGSKGYPFANPDVRERQIGLFVGVNFVEILRTAGVPEGRWWGKILYFLFDVIRIPYTQIGYQYDINRGRWHGPSIGDSFPGGTPSAARTLAIQ
jgi:hypothetical protein